MAKKSGVFFVGICKKFIQSPEVKNLYRVKVSDFTRNRKFGFEGLVYCLICPFTRACRPCAVKQSI
jgi:hypothetical protein